MSGWKTYVGTIGYGICAGIKAVFPEYAALCDTLANAVFAPLGVIGVAHKIEKINQ